MRGGRIAAAALRRAGFADVQRQAHAFETTAMDRETFGGNPPMIIRDYLAGLGLRNGGMTPER